MPPTLRQRRRFRERFRHFRKFFGQCWHKKIFKVGDLVAAVVSSIKSSKSELSSQFFGRLKFLTVFWLKPVTSDKNQKKDTHVRTKLNENESENKNETGEATYAGALHAPRAGSPLSFLFSLSLSLVLI